MASMIITKTSEEWSLAVSMVITSGILLSSSYGLQGYVDHKDVGSELRLQHTQTYLNSIRLSKGLKRFLYTFCATQKIAQNSMGKRK